ncbi:MAG: putative cytosolic protein, partial [Deltaproteobacteria bacterium]|nr:putative cytosolic protein [Deltaproteobacteria bacterium]
SGMFYPDDPIILRKDIGKYLKAAEIKPLSSDIRAVISPHAGYVYSGQVAAYGYKAVSAHTFDTVIVLAPSHRAYFQGIAIWDEGVFKTPLGNITVDAGSAGALLRSNGVFRVNREVHKGEHSLEVQLPFLQYIFKDFLLLPLLIGAANEDMYEEAAETLAHVILTSERRFLIIASTDLSHYYPYDAAVKIDAVTIEHIRNYDIAGMVRDTRSEKAQACGAGPLLTTMMAAMKLGARSSSVLKYANSGDVTGDRSGVVGYVSAILFKNNT